MDDVGLLARMRALENSVRALEDRSGIEQLFYHYGMAIDYGHADAFLDLFVADAIFELRYRPGMVPRAYGSRAGADGRVVYRGREMLRAFIAGHTHAPDVYHKHIVTGIDIVLAGMAADCSSYFLRVDAMPAAGATASAGIVAAGRYLDHVVRGADGKWRFGSRVAEIELQGR